MKIAFLHGPPPEKERPATVGTEAGRNVENQCNTASITAFATAKAIASKKRLHDRAFKLFCGIPRRAFSEDALDTLIERLFDLRAGRNADIFKAIENRNAHWLDAPCHSKLKREERETIAEVLDGLLEDAKIDESDAQDAIFDGLRDAARWHRSGARMVA